MDHILENESKPVPDISAVTETPSAAPPRTGDDMEVDEDDAAAIRAALGQPPSSSGASDDPGTGTVDAKVRAVLVMG